MIQEANATAVCTSDIDDILVGMGMAALAGAPRRLRAVVGSCVGVTVYSPRLRLGMLSHVVLPHANGRTAYPAKYADTAVVHMRSALESRGARAGQLVAKIVGGARMFGDGLAMRIGEANAQAAAAALQEAGIPLAGSDVGGSAGRRLVFDLATGDVAVESVGRRPRNI
jgi:chemotaxis protein CheD